ncbi:MAG: DNA topology modulation protein FlaR [Candidatus Hydrogenedentes bacterium]|nr:DNA topology modulation protein FlaR [Candidatus Hydrogenedentota bacterium]
MSNENGANANPPRRIHIVGGPGSGKSYLGRTLAAALGVPVCDLDSLFWDNDHATYGVRAEPDVRDRKLAEFVAQDGWVVEGVYHAWVGASFERAEAIVVLRPGPILRDARIVRRFLARKLGLERAVKKETLAGLIGLLRWNHGYDNDNLARALDALEPYEHKVHAFRSADAAAAFLLATPEA